MYHATGVVPQTVPVNRQYLQTNVKFGRQNTANLQKLIQKRGKFVRLGRGGKKIWDFRLYPTILRRPDTDELAPM